MLARSYAASVPFAEDLVGQGVRIYPRSATPLNNLVNLSAPIDFAGFVSEIEVPGSKKALDEHSNTEFLLGHNSTGETGKLWGIPFDNYVDELVSLLNTQISYIRNTVVPRTLEFSNEAQAFIELLGRSNASKDLEIFRASLSELSTDQSFLSLMETYKFRSIVKPSSMSMSLPFQEAPVDFLTVASLSNNRLDGLTASWLRSLPFNYLERAWYSFFSDQSIKGYNSGYFYSDELGSPDLYHRLNVAMAYFLIANYYSSHAPDVVVNETSASINRRLYEHLLYAGTVVINTLEMIQAGLASGLLVTFVDITHKKITVSSEVYDKWLASGGSSETILGILVGEKRYYTVEEIDKNSEALKAVWNKYVRYTLDSVEMNKAKTLRTFYRGLASKYMGSAFQDEVERGYLVTFPQFLDQVDKKAEAYLYALTAPELSNVQVVARELIAGIKYSYTYANKFICDMEEIGHLTENIDPSEAALMATVNYIVDHILGQIGSTKF